MSLSFLKENEWDIENIECRIDNEAYALGISGFNLIKDGITLNFTGVLKLIDAVKIVYQLEDSGFNMYKECKSVLNMSKDNRINVSFLIKKSISESILADIKINEKLSLEEEKHLQDFENHITLMLNIWKQAMIKRWITYFENDQLN
jgi:hypothetical protein